MNGIWESRRLRGRENGPRSTSGARSFLRTMVSGFADPLRYLVLTSIFRGFADSFIESFRLSTPFVIDASM